MGLSTEQRFIPPVLLEAINSQGKSGSIHGFNEECPSPSQGLGSKRCLWNLEEKMNSTKQG